MRVDDWATFGQYSFSAARRPEFVVQIVYAAETVSFTSHDAPLNLAGRVLENTVSGISSITQRVYPLDGRAEIGGLTVKIVDNNSARNVYDFGDTAAASLTPSGWGIPETTPFKVTGKFNITDYNKTQSIWYINNFVQFRITSSGAVNIYDHSSTGFPNAHAGLVVIYGEENSFVFEHDGAGNYIVELNGVQASGTMMLFDGTLNYIRFGQTSSNNSGARIYDMRFYERGTLRHWWPMNEGIGNKFHDRIRGNDSVISSASEPGWTTLVSPHVTQEIRDKLSDGVGESMRDREIRVWMGYTGDFDDYVMAQTTYAQSVSYGDHEYSITCGDVTRQIRKDIFEPKTCRLGADLTVGATTITTDSTGDFRPLISTGPDVYGDIMLTHTAAYSESPSVKVGYLKIKDTGEIIKYTGVTATTFTGCVRGTFTTDAAEILYKIGEPIDKQPEIIEFIYLEMPAPQLAESLITGICRNEGADIPLPAHWHTGVATNKINQTEWDNIGTDLYDGDAGGIILLFNHLKKTDGKKFVEQEIFRLVGIYAPINANGTMGLKRVNTALSGAAHDVVLNENTTISYGDLKYSPSDIVNQYRVDYEWDGEQFLRSVLFTDADSITRNGVAKQTVLTFLGLKISRHSEGLIYSLVNAYVDRYRDSPETITLSLVPYMDRIEAGDTAKIQISTIPDYSGSGSLNRSFEIQQVAKNYVTGSVTVSGFASSAEASPPLYVPQLALHDSFYSNKGTVVTTPLTIVGGVMTVNGTLTGNADMNAAGAVYYYAGDLTIQAGITLTITQNVQLRVLGTLTINGTINGNGEGAAGGVDPNTDSAAYVGYAAGTSGYVGGNYSGDTLALIFPSNNYNNADGFATLGDNSSFPALSIDAGDQVTLPVPLDLSGIPSNLRGTSGASGRATVTAGFCNSKGGNGGDSGSGFCVIARGVALGVAGEIDLSGGNGLVGSDNGVVQPGTGAGGGPGCLLILIDGPATLPSITGKFIADYGSTTPVGNTAKADRSVYQLFDADDWNGGIPDPSKLTGKYEGVYEGAPVNIKTGSLATACYRILYIPD